MATPSLWKGFLPVFGSTPTKSFSMNCTLLTRRTSVQINSQDFTPRLNLEGGSTKPKSETGYRSLKNCARGKRQGLVWSVTGDIKGESKSGTKSKGATKEAKRPARHRKAGQTCRHRDFQSLVIFPPNEADQFVQHGQRCFCRLAFGCLQGFHYLRGFCSTAHRPIVRII